MASPGAVIAWHAVDPDGDPVAVSLWFRDEAGGGDEQLIAAGLPAAGSLTWTPLNPEKTESGPDLNADGQVDFRDVFLLSGRWGETGRRYRIIACAEDARKAEQRAASTAVVVAPERFPMQESGLTLMLQAWHEEP